MNKQVFLTKVLAVAGTSFTWLPILAPILFTASRLLQRAPFRFDYLMPAELFPAALLGGGLLTWAELRIHPRWRIIIWSLGIAVIALVGGQLLAVLTGIASGESEPAGFGFALVILSIAIYTLAVVVMGMGGIFLLRDVFRTSSTRVSS